MIDKIDIVSLGHGFHPIHPGKVLKDELEVRGIPQRKFAGSTGMGYPVLNEILSGCRSLSTTTVLTFEAALGVPAESLMKLQLKYNMQTARIDKISADKLKKIARAAALL